MGGRRGVDLLWRHGHIAVKHVHWEIGYSTCEHVISGCGLDMQWRKATDVGMPMDVQYEKNAVNVMLYLQVP